MVDIFDAKTRKKMMSSVKNKNTGVEIILRKKLNEAGIRGYRLHRRDIFGAPDIAWIGKKVAVFVDGAFWHGHPSYFKLGKSGDFWDKKILSNVERDKKVNLALEENGWTVIRIWDFEIKKSIESAMSRIKQALK